MDLNRMLERCQGLEERAAGLYRRWAAATREDPGLCSLWTGLAREEDAHACAVRRSHLALARDTGWRTQIEGWEAAVRDIEERLADAERLGQWATADQQLAAALALEITEIDGLRHLLLSVTGQLEPEDDPEAHAAELAKAAQQRSTDAHVRVLAALLLAQSRIRKAS